MKEFKGTPGPWKWRKRHGVSSYLANESESNDGSPIIIDDGSACGEYLAVIDVNGHDAKLIAAAPELLDALQDMLSGWQYIRQVHGDLCGVGWDMAQDKAMSAINKAIGGE